MKNTFLTNKTTRHPLLIAMVAAFAVGCSTDDAATNAYNENESISLGDSATSSQKAQVLDNNKYGQNAGSANTTSGSSWSSPADRTDSEAFQTGNGNSIDSASPQNPTERQAASRSGAGSNQDRYNMQADIAGDQGWNLYREYNFTSSSNVISQADSINAADIADYMDQYPDVQVGIDGAEQAHVETVRDALISVGIPEESILIGEFDQDILRGNGRVAVLVSN